MSKAVVVIPTYNEVDNLPELVAQLFALGLPGLEVLVVDDASPDGTGQVADQLVAKYSGRLHVMHRSGKLGLGSAYIQGFHWALKNQADYVLQMDADFSHSPRYIPKLLEGVMEGDVALGSRYVRGGRLDENWGLGRRLLSWWANSVWVRLILGLNTHDATTGFRCWRGIALQDVLARGIHSNGYVFLVELCYVAEQLGFRIKEIPIYFEDRRRGNSKMSLPVQLDAALGVLKIWRTHHHLRRLKAGAL